MMTMRTKLITGTSIAILGIAVISSFSTNERSEQILSITKQNDQTQVTENSELSQTSYSTPLELQNASDSISQTDNLGQTYTEEHVAHISSSEYANQSQFGSLPSHMQGVGFLPLQFDEYGNFVANDNLTGMIEHFLLAAEDEGRDQALARLTEYLEMVLPGSAAIQAQEIVDQYLAYKERIGEEIYVDQAEPNLYVLADQIENMVEKKKAIRREVMSPEVANALFAREEALDDFNITTMRLNLDNKLSYEQKDDLIAQAETLLPPEIQQKKKYAREKRNLKRDIAGLKKVGGKEQEIYEKRKAFYGKETADRITYFEDFSDDWRQRVEHFQTQKVGILKQGNLSQEEQAEQINYLKSSMFSEQEQMKLAVYNIRKRAGTIN